jgi:hypothetical protein
MRAREDLADLEELLADLRELIDSARSLVAQAVNSALVLLYWEETQQSCHQPPFGSKLPEFRRNRLLTRHETLVPEGVFCRESRGQPWAFVGFR